MTEGATAGTTNAAAADDDVRIVRPLAAPRTSNKKAAVRMSRVKAIRIKRGKCTKKLYRHITAIC